MSTPVDPVDGQGGGSSDNGLGVRIAHLPVQGDTFAANSESCRGTLNADDGCGKILSIPIGHHKADVGRCLSGRGDGKRPDEEKKRASHRRQFLVIETAQDTIRRQQQRILNVRFF